RVTDGHRRIHSVSLFVWQRLEGRLPNRRHLRTSHHGPGYPVQRRPDARHHERVGLRNEDFRRNRGDDRSGLDGLSKKLTIIADWNRGRTSISFYSPLLGVCRPPLLLPAAAEGTIHFDEGRQLRLASLRER